MTKIIAVPLTLICCLWAATMYAAGGQSDSACVKHSFKEVKTVTHFSLTHRPTTKKILYDDIGCGLKWRKKQCSSIQMSFDSSAIVYDFNTLAEIVVRKATFVMSTDIKTPMGSGLIAFTNSADAEAFISGHSGGGKKLSYEELILLDL